MNPDHCYQAMLRCALCEEETRHRWNPEERKFTCLVCDSRSKFSDDLADIAKAAERLMRRRTFR